jgi:RHS repeat-associated protein
MRSMIYNAPIIDRTLEPRVTQSLACAPAGSADVATDPLLWSTVFRPLSEASQANELHGYFSMEPQEIANADHSNQQYSITAVTTSAGTIAERYAYSAYGEPTVLDGSGSVLASSAINNRYSYTGREWDATVGLHHFRARWMSPKTGRFLGRDPIGYEGSDWDLYEFMGGNVQNRVDPNGETSLMYMATCEWCKSCNTTCLAMTPWAGPPKIECTSQQVACPVPLGKNGKPLMFRGQLLLDPNTCCGKQKVPGNWNPWCTEYMTGSAHAGGPTPLDNDCKRELASWIGSAGQGQGSLGHTNCLAWCENCVLKGGTPGTPAYGQLKDICFNQVCGNAFG